MPKKLSKPQEHVLYLMNQGWELGVDIIDGRARLQKGGIGYGGETESVRRNTFLSLIRSRTICTKEEGFPILIYGLNT